MWCPGVPNLFVGVVEHTMMPGPNSSLPPPAPAFSNLSAVSLQRSYWAAANSIEAVSRVTFGEGELTGAVVK